MINLHFKLSLMYFYLLLFIPILGFAQGSGNNGGNFKLNFDDGFKHTLVEIKDSASKKTIYKGYLQTNERLGFAYSVILSLSNKYYVKINKVNYLIAPNGKKYAYASYFKNKLTVRYSEKKELYQ